VGGRKESKKRGREQNQKRPRVPTPDDRQIPEGRSETKRGKSGFGTGMGKGNRSKGPAASPDRAGNRGKGGIEKGRQRAEEGQPDYERQNGPTDDLRRKKLVNLYRAGQWRHKKGGTPIRGLRF